LWKAESLIRVSLGQNNVTVDNSTISDVNHGIGGWGSNFDSHNNEIYNCGRCLVWGPNVPVTGFTWHDNIVHDINLGGTGVHCDGIHMFPNTGSGQMSNVTIYNNLFYNPCNGFNTAYMYFEGVFVAPKVFNNVCINQASQADPCIEMGSGSGPQTITNPVVVNNTILGGDEGQAFDVLFGPATTGVIFKNNVVTGSNTLMSLQTGGSFAAGGLNNNAYELLTQTGNMYGYHGSTITTFSGWQAATGQDANSTSQPIANLKLNSDGTLQSGSPAIGLGVNLTSLGIPALNSDKAGIARPSTGAWDAGAYKF